MADPIKKVDAAKEALDLAKQLEEVLRRQQAYEEDLLEGIQDRNKLQEISLKVLKNISKEKSIQEEIQEKISHHTRNVNDLERNIAGRELVVSKLKNLFVKSDQAAVKAQQDLLDLENERIKGWQYINKLQNLMAKRSLEIDNLSKLPNVLNKIGLEYDRYLILQDRQLRDSDKQLKVLTHILDIETAKLTTQENITRETKNQEKLIDDIEKHNIAIIESLKEVEQQQLQLSRTTVKGWFTQNETIGKVGKSIGNVNTAIHALGGPINTIGTSIGTGWIGKIGGFGITAFVALLYKAWDIFKEFDEAAFEFRKQWGFSRATTEDIDKRVRSIATNLTRLGVTFSDVYATTTALGKEVGSIVNFSDELLGSVALFNKQYGIAVETSAKFLKITASISNNSVNSQVGMMGFAKGLSDAAKVPLADVMNDIASASAAGYSYLNKTPAKLIQSAVEARRMGTSLTSLVNTAKGLLSFTQSIQDEMEFAVLTGQNIDFQNARQLAYRKDILGLNKEILKLAKQSDFNNLDPFQAAAFARLVNKSEEEVAKLLQTEVDNEKLLKYATDSKNTKLLEEIKVREKRMSMSQKEAELDGEALGRQLISENNQTRLADIQLSIKQSLQEIAVKLLPVIDFILKGIANVLQHGWVKWMIRGGIILGAAVGSATLLKMAFIGMISSSGIILGIWTKISALITYSSVAWARAGAAAGTGATAAGAAAATGAGWAAWGTKAANVLKFGLKRFWVAALAGTAYTLLKEINSEKEKMRRKSEAERGVISPTSTNKVEQEMGRGYIKFTSEIEKMRRKSASVTPINNNRNNAASLSSLPQATETEVSLLERQPSNNIINKEAMDNQVASNKEVVGAINKLNDNLVNGNIAVNMDSQLVSARMNRSTRFTGQYGALQG